MRIPRNVSNKNLFVVLKVKISIVFLPSQKSLARFKYLCFSSAFALSRKHHYLHHTSPSVCPSVRPYIPPRLPLDGFKLYVIFGKIQILSKCGKNICPFTKEICTFCCRRRRITVKALSSTELSSDC
jgi:hypothetical protein